MKYEDVNKAYTDRINMYLSKGYVFNTGTMPGSQGEIAKIDLTNGIRIIRVMIERFVDWEGKYMAEGVQIVTGMCDTANITPNAMDQHTIWNNELYVLSMDRFYAIGENSKGEMFYGVKGEAERAAELRAIRHHRNRSDSSKKEFDLKSHPDIVEMFKRKIKAERGLRKISNTDISVGKDSVGYFYAYRGVPKYLH